MMLKSKPYTHSLHDSNLKLDDVISVSYENGRLVLLIRDDVEIRHLGNKSEVIEGKSSSFAKGSVMQLSGEEHHVQPTGIRGYTNLWAGAPNATAVDLMTGREKMYNEMSIKAARRDFYVSAARRNLMRKRKRNDCKC